MATLAQHAPAETAPQHWTEGNPTAADLAHIPGEGGWPIVGNTLKLLWNPVRFGNGMREKYGSLFWTYSFGRHNVVMFGLSVT